MLLFTGGWLWYHRGKTLTVNHRDIGTRTKWVKVLFTSLPVLNYCEWKRHCTVGQTLYVQWSMHRHCSLLASMALHGQAHLWFWTKGNESKNYNGHDLLWVSIIDNDFLSEDFLNEWSCMMNKMATSANEEYSSSLDIITLCAFRTKLDQMIGSEPVWAKRPPNFRRCLQFLFSNYSKKVRIRHLSLGRVCHIL